MEDVYARRLSIYHVHPSLEALSYNQPRISADKAVGHWGKSGTGDPGNLMAGTLSAALSPHGSCYSTSLIVNYAPVTECAAKGTGHATEYAMC
jgi:hypothetical protein